MKTVTSTQSRHTEGVHSALQNLNFRLSVEKETNYFAPGMCGFSNLVILKADEREKSWSSLTRNHPGPRSVVINPCGEGEHTNSLKSGKVEGAIRCPWCPQCTGFQERSKVHHEQRGTRFECKHRLIPIRYYPDVCP